MNIWGIFCIINALMLVSIAQTEEVEEEALEWPSPDLPPEQRNGIIDTMLNKALNNIRSHMKAPIDQNDIHWPRLDPWDLFNHTETQLDVGSLSVRLGLDSTVISGLSKFEFANIVSTGVGISQFLPPFIHGEFIFHGITIDTDIEIDLNYIGIPLNISGPLHLELNELALNLTINLLFLLEQPRNAYMNNIEFQYFDVGSIKVEAGNGDLMKQISKFSNILIEDFREYGLTQYVRPTLVSAISAAAVTFLNYNYKTSPQTDQQTIKMVTTLSSLK